MSKCGNCGSFSFKLEEVSPERSKYKFYFVQCSMCNVPVGVVDYIHTGSNIEDLGRKLDRKIEDLSNKVDAIDHNLRILGSRNNRL